MRATAVRSRAGLLKVAAWAGAAVRSVPGAAGALLISGGIYEVYRPAGIITAGLFLIALDRQL
jgi:hypothetical protein